MVNDWYIVVIVGEIFEVMYDVKYSMLLRKKGIICGFYRNCDRILILFC